MHNGLPLSLLDFLLVTAMLLVTPTDEWMNVTRTNPSESSADAGQTSSTTSPDNSQSLDTHPSYSPLSSENPDVEAPLHTSEATPAIERWRSGVSTPAMEDSCEDSIDDQSSSTASRATSRLSFHTDMQSATQHSSSLSPQGAHSTHSSSSLSLPSPQLVRRKTRELPVPPLRSAHGYTYDRGPPSASSHISHMPYMTHGRPSQDELPPIPPLPSSSSISSQYPPRLAVTNPLTVSPRRVAVSPTSNIHGRSLPIPPIPATSKARSPSLPHIHSGSAVTFIPPSPLPAPIPPVPQPPLLSRPRSYSHLQNASAHPETPHAYESPIKAPPNYDASAHDPPPLPIRAHVPTQRAGAGHLLSIRTENVPPVPSAASASTSSTATSLASEEGDPYDMPPAYSVLDMCHSPLRLRAVNGNMGDGMTR
jgi:hypothetical protein